MSNGSRERPTCKHCGSSDIRADAWAMWDDNAQQWVLTSTYDNYWCESCEIDEVTLEWVPSIQQTEVTA